MLCATAPTVTVVATPEPEGPPNKNEDSTTVLPTLDVLPPMMENEKSMKNLPAPLNCKNAPKMVNKIMRVEETSTAVPKIPSKVMYIKPTKRESS